MNKGKLFSLVALLSAGVFAGVLLSLALRFNTKNAHAQEQMYFGANVDKSLYISTFYVADNKIGFFDSRDSKIYIYDLGLNRCEKILSLQALGAPLLEIRR